jgi:membrane dipeptidase
VSDDQLEALAARGGVLGLMPHPLVVDPATPTLARFVEHVDHAVEVMGIDHVGLGGDFLRQIARAICIGDNVVEGVRADSALDGLEGPHEYGRLVAALRERGYDDEAVAAITAQNMLRVLRDGLGRAA